jgi:hypothetical protein
MSRALRYLVGARREDRAFAHPTLSDLAKSTEIADISLQQIVRQQVKSA